MDDGETTAAGTIVGTAAYLAPEQVLGTRADSASDVFALGLVLIECLTGRREYPGPPAESALARLHRLPTVPQGLPRGISRILEQMTAWDPAERPDAGECAVVFGRPSPIFQIPASPARTGPEPGTDDETTWIHPEAIPPAAGRRRSGGPLCAAVAAIALAAVAGIAMVASSPAGGSPVVQVPTGMARPQPTTPAGGSAGAVAPYRQPSPSSPSWPSSPLAGSSLAPAVEPAWPSTAPLAAVVAEPETRRRRTKARTRAMTATEASGGGEPKRATANFPAFHRAHRGGNPQTPGVSPSTTTDRSLEHALI